MQCCLVPVDEVQLPPTEDAEREHTGGQAEDADLLCEAEGECEGDGDCVRAGGGSAGGAR